MRIGNNILNNLREDKEDTIDSKFNQVIIMLGEIIKGINDEDSKTKLSNIMVDIFNIQNDIYRDSKLIESSQEYDLDESINNKKLYKEATDEEAEKMLSIQRWMESNDFEDRWSEGAGWTEPNFEYMKKQNYDSFVNEKRHWVAYKDKEALPDFDEMVKSLNKEIITEEPIYESMINEKSN